MIVLLSAGHAKLGAAELKGVALTAVEVVREADCVLVVVSPFALGAGAEPSKDCTDVALELELDDRLLPTEVLLVLARLEDTGRVSLIDVGERILEMAGMIPGIDIPGIDGSEGDAINPDDREDRPRPKLGSREEPIKPEGMEGRIVGKTVGKRMLGKESDGKLAV